MAKGYFSNGKAINLNLFFKNAGISALDVVPIYISACGYIFQKNSPAKYTYLSSLI
jgi:hypothetical protein